jgi:putative peptidoglycan lipid II flippase
VAAGILLSRLAGLVRQKIFAHVLGSGLEAAAYLAAMRIPNILQNLLGEGVLSASFIPTYAGLRSEGRDDEAKRVAGAVFGLLALLVSVLVALGLLGAPFLVELIAPGYTGRARALTIDLVRIIFPGTGVLVLSAWCLGILNSHKRFFLSYAAPVVMNVAIITGLLAYRHAELTTLVLAAAWATVAGSVLQFVVQLPNVWRLLGRIDVRPTLSGAVKPVITGFLPAVASRGVVQVSAYVDTAYASLLSVRAVSVLSYAQIIAQLPIALFGMAISAAELPDMSADAVKSHDERAAALKGRLSAGLSRLSFFVVPSAVAFLLLGDLLAAVLLESGHFTAADSRFTWYILLGSGVALLAQTSGRLYSSAFFALKDTRTPLKFAATRVALGIALGYVAVQWLPGWLGLPKELGAVFITVTTSVTAWLEMVLLRGALAKQLGPVPTEPGRLARLWGAAFVAGGLALGLKVALTAHFGPRAAALTEWGGSVLAPPDVPPLLVSLALLGVFGVTYFAFTGAMGIPQAKAVLLRLGLAR